MGDSPSLGAKTQKINMHSAWFNDQEKLVFVLKGNLFFTDEIPNWKARIFIDGIMWPFNKSAYYAEGIFDVICGFNPAHIGIVVRNGCTVKVDIIDTQATFYSREGWFYFLKNSYAFEDEYIAFLISHFLNPIIAMKIVEFEEEL